MQSKKEGFFQSRSALGKICICFTIVVILGVLIFLSLNWKRIFRQYKVTQKPIQFTQTLDNPCNYRQTGHNIRLFQDGGKLYFYPYGYNAKNRLFYRELCVIENGKVKSVADFPMLFALQDGYAYYDGINKIGESKICSYNLSSGEQKTLAEMESFSLYDVRSENGICYIPADFEKTAHYPLSNGQMGELVHKPERYLMGDKYYAIEHFLDLVCYDSNGKRTVLYECGRMGHAWIIPCAEGLLIYNNEETTMLYYIPEATGEVMELFSVPGFAADSAVNVYGNDVYISFLRYHAPDGCSTNRYEDDELAGTYRISLTDYSSEKISDAVYEGLYIFDNSGIYACDENCNIYKLDFDGQVIETILEY